MPATSSLATPLDRAGAASATGAAAIAWCLLIATDAIVGWGGAPTLLKAIRAFPVRARRAQAPAAGDLLDALRRASVFGVHRYRCLKYWGAAACLLRLYGHQASFVIGVTKYPFQSHAWIEHGGEIVGRDEIEGVNWVVIFRA